MSIFLPSQKDELGINRTEPANMDDDDDDDELTKQNANSRIIFSSLKSLQCFENCLSLVGLPEVAIFTILENVLSCKRTWVLEKL